MKRKTPLLFFIVFSGFMGSALAQLQFVPNEGQWAEPFLYKAILPNTDIYLEQNGLTYVVGAAANAEKIHAHKEKATNHDDTLFFHAYKMKWVGAAAMPKTSGGDKQSFYHNYFLGKNAAQWRGNVPVYGSVEYMEIYTGVGVRFSAGKGHLKYDYLVAAGADASAIKSTFEGITAARIVNGDLLLTTSVGTIFEKAPYAYQVVHGAKKEVACQYKWKNNELGFAFPDGYNQSLPLVIDPTVVFATLTGSTADNWGFTATYDNSGNLYAGGIVGGTGYPTTTGAFQTTYAGGTWDISISKFNASGTSLIYSTYLGGAADDMPHSLVVDDSNHLILAGKTLSANFPVKQGCYDTSHNGSYDIIVSKFNEAGTVLLGSTYIGGSGDDGVNVSPNFYGNHDSLRYNYGDGSRTEVIVDRQGNIYVAASSQSAGFPITANAAKTSLTGTQDGVLLKMNSSLSQLVYSTFIGGSSFDAAYVLTLDTSETHVYVGGGTQSSNFHTAAAVGAWRSSYQGGTADGFICKFLNSGTYPLQKVTFVGTSAYDQIYGLQTDLEDRVYAMGQTMGAFPVSSGVYSNAGSRQFLIKLDTALATAYYSTVFGTGASANPNISPVAFMVDTCQNVYISGWGSSLYSTSGLSTTGMPVTTGAFQTTTDGNDFYFVVFSKNALALLYGSYFGAVGKEEHVDGGTSRFDPQGVVYQAICASCGSGSGFPATTGAYATTKGSSNCNLGALKIAFNLGSVSAAASVTPNASGCAPLTVNFGNTSSNATGYYWDFDDNGATSTAATPSYVFNTPGVYHVMLVAINPNACKTHDTAYLTVTVSDQVIGADFNFVLHDTCSNPYITITNTSTALPNTAMSAATYQWYYGDGGSYTGTNPGSHAYAANGTYNVMLVMSQNGACNSPDTVIKTLTIDPINVAAAFDMPDSLCLNDTLALANASSNGTGYSWSFGTGQGTSSDMNPSYKFSQPGTYTVRLIVTNPNSCNKADTATKQITVLNAPTAAFTYTPLTAQTNTATTFVNQSIDAVRYEWSFGDGTGSTETNPVHSFLRSGNFSVCLTAYNGIGCPDKVCKTVYADVIALADVPTAFSPNGDGNNDVLYVRGFNIADMDFRVYNRWGQLVFSSQDQSIGWDGTYNGKAQEMEVYAFTLKVNFLDGTSMNKQGNVTLLR
ncbi:MAG: PKD domain-containing protein [Edaphocola sp.]